ncbi:MAG: murein hydrolase activator EnvC family protein [Actinomycetota bacterium]
MAENRTHARRLVVRVLGALAALSLVAAMAAPLAGAAPPTKEQLDDAKAQFEQLKREIEGQQAHLNQLALESAEIAERWEQAYGRYTQITDELRTTTLQLRDAQDEYQRLQDKLEARAREVYITGPGTELEFLLGATSLADLSARMEYVNALNETDADLATEVQNLKNDLSAEQADQQDLQASAARLLRRVETEQAALDAAFAEQQAVLNDLEAKRAQAEELVEKLEKKYERELAALTGLQFYADGVLKVCPVGQPRAVYDGFGAPRYGGGYHPHAGNDIIAPQGTEIYATFDGNAVAGSNSLGGYAVNVYGELGYTYNAHLMQPGYTGPVQAGQVIGYVGATGDTSTPHNHFEWHPYQTPTNWPVSPYGYSVIQTGSSPAVNPYPLLAQVC